MFASSAHRPGCSTVCTGVALQELVAASRKLTPAVREKIMEMAWGTS